PSPRAPCGATCGPRWPSLRSFRSCCDTFTGCFGGDRQTELTLVQDRVDPRDVVADGAQSPIVVQLPGGHLEAQVEQLFLGLAQPRLELVVVQLAQLSGVRPCGHQRSPSRVTMRHFIGSLWIARVSAVRATASFG